MKKAVVIGAGIGGLSSAILLSSKGYRVTIIEKNTTIGGKMGQVKAMGYRFDTGPSLLTMPHLLHELFTTAGLELNDYLSLHKLDHLCHYHYPNGTTFENWASEEKTLEEVKRIAPDDVVAYKTFMNESTQLFEKTESVFLRNPLFEFKDLKSLPLLDLLKIDAFSSVSEKVDRSFSSTYLRQFFKRFTTYNGSSPFQAPATLNVIPHVELRMGAYYVKGGIFQIAKALQRACTELGCEWRLGEEVCQLNGTKTLLEEVELLSGERIEADVVISNSDASFTTLELLKEYAGKRECERAKKTEPSSSGFVILLGVEKEWSQLRHHNIFFSSNYSLEFDQIFKQRVCPQDPTIYVTNTSFTDKADAPTGHSNLFILTNTPYLPFEMPDTYGDQIIEILERRGLKELKKQICYREEITPIEFEKRFYSNRGSIYGTSSNALLSAFLRPRNAHRRIQNLYFVGGSTHPGGGIPLVLLSSFHAIELLERRMRA